MQIQKEVELYLQLCGEVHMSVDSYRTIQPGDICWLIAHPHWPILRDFNQTVTANGRHLILEMWHDVTESDDPELSECLAIDVSLKTLHSRLIDMAEKGSRKFIESLASEEFWTMKPEGIERLFNQLPPKHKDRARKLIANLQADIKALEDAIATKAPIKRLIALSENLEKETEDLNQLRHS
jgi:hypothetical protein